MFWAEFSGGSAVLGGYLDRGDFTLTDLLEHDDILQECKSQNKKLVEFLEDKNTIKELINLIINEPANQDDPYNCYRHAALSCEIITTGLPGLIQNMTTDNELLQTLFSFLDSKPPLNPLLASFFAKTLQSLLTRQYGQDWYSYQLTCLRVLEYSKHSINFLPKLLEHLGTSAIMDTIQFIIHINVEDMKKDFLNWLDSQNFIENLIQIICGKFETVCNGLSDTIEIDNCIENTENQTVTEDIKNESFDERIYTDRSENAAKLLCDMIYKGRDLNDDCNVYKTDPLFMKCSLSSTVNFLLKSMFSAPIEMRQSAIINGIQVLLTLLNDSSSSMKSPSMNQSETEQIAESILLFITNFKDIIVEMPPLFQYGYSKPIESPVGAVRLAVIHLFEVLYFINSNSIVTTMVDYKIMPLLLDMFSKYKWNNFLHAHIITILRKMFETVEYKEIYSNHLFIECKLLDRIINAWEENDEMQKQQQPRIGYMGHLIQMTNYTSNYLITIPDVMDKIEKETIDKWNLLHIKLEETNKIQNIYLGGYHPIHANNDVHLNHQKEYQKLKAQLPGILFDVDENTILKNAHNAEQLFESICENTPNSMGDDAESATFWSDTVISSLDDSECSKNFQSGTKTINDIAILGLASKLSGCEVLNDEFDRWFSKISEGWDDSDALETSPINIQPSITITNSSPWGSNNMGDDSTNWADFQNTHMQFTCDPFAVYGDDTFDQNDMSTSKLEIDSVQVPINEIDNFVNKSDVEETSDYIEPSDSNDSVLNDNCNGFNNDINDHNVECSDKNVNSTEALLNDDEKNLTHSDPAPVTSPDKDSLNLCNLKELCLSTLMNNLHIDNQPVLSQPEELAPQEDVSKKEDVVTLLNTDVITAPTTTVHSDTRTCNGD